MGKIVYSALTIAGLDSCGGAGVTTDLKTFSLFRVHGACVVTALTAQNTKGVKAVLPVDPEFVKKQFKTVLDDMEIYAAKTGILPTKEIVDVVVSFVKDYGLNLVVDPVFRSATGKKFVSNSVIEAYIRKLLPLASIVTPNIYEAKILSGVKIRNVDDMVKAAEKIFGFGASSVVVKGGHLKGKNVTDLFYDKGKSVFYTKPRKRSILHGGGCFFSAALTACLTNQMDAFEAVETVESLIQEVFGFGLKIGRGLDVIIPLIPLYNKAEMYKVAEKVEKALNIFLENKLLHKFVAEVGTQIAEALPFPSKIYHVAAVDGRIRIVNGKIKFGKVRFGVSSHMARLILACNKFNPEVRAAINLHYDKKLLEAFKKEGFLVSSFDRRLEPKRFKLVEGKTLEWGVNQAIRKAKKFPDVIYDLGEPGKEPMIRVVGKDAVEVVRKVCSVLKHLKPTS
jgi:hydroxymethylpyrimidine/phosphomethylpyrimidine kinase